MNKPKRLLRNVCVKGKGVEKKFLTVRRVLRDFYIYIRVIAFSGYNKKKGATLDRVSLSLSLFLISSLFSFYIHHYFFQPLVLSIDPDEDTDDRL